MSQSRHLIIMKNARFITTFLALLIAACVPLSAEQAPETYSAYYLVTTPPDATATPTPFRPYAPLVLNGQAIQATQQPPASPTLPALQPTTTSFPTSTTSSAPHPQPPPVPNQHNTRADLQRLPPHCGPLGGAYRDNLLSQTHGPAYRSPPPKKS